jgi:hypothetical protein
MKPTWYRASFALHDSHERAAGDLSVFFDYDLRCWTFGFRVDNDPSWLDLVIEVGPLRLSLMRWKTPVFILGDE